MTASAPEPLPNFLLAALSARARKHFIAGCDEIELVLGEVLAEVGERTRYVYFPTRGVIATIAGLSRDVRLQVGLVGNEGMLGSELLLDVQTVQLQALVQGAGSSLRMTATNFRRELNLSPPLRQRLNRYVCVLMHQFVQMAFCARYHNVDARLARWLLMTQDRVPGNQFHLTQEFMAYVLGVRRVGVTEAAGVLRALGAIHYNRGELRIIDRTTLQGAACGCYTQETELYERIMSVDLQLSP